MIKYLNGSYNNLWFTAWVTTRYAFRLHSHIWVRDPRTARFVDDGMRFVSGPRSFQFACPKDPRLVRSIVLNIYLAGSWISDLSHFHTLFRGHLYNFLGLNHQGGSISKKLFWKELKNEVSIQLMTCLFRFHTLKNFHLTFDLRQLSKISSFHPFLSNRKNVSTVAFSPKMRNKLRVESLGRVYEPTKNEFCRFEFWDLY